VRDFDREGDNNEAGVILSPAEGEKLDERNAAFSRLRRARRAAGLASLTIRYRRPPATQVSTVNSSWRFRNLSPSLAARRGPEK
jgi:hypothetical protein